MFTYILQVYVYNTVERSIADIYNVKLIYRCSRIYCPRDCPNDSMYYIVR